MDANISTIGGTDTGRLILYVPGAICPACESIEPLAALLKQYGEVACVEYGARGRDALWEEFNPAEVVHVATDYIDVMQTSGFDKFLLVGASLGGPLAYDIAKSRPEVQFDFVSVCSPFYGARDIHFPLRAVAPARHVLTHRVVAQFNRCEVMERIMFPPKDENLEPGVERGPLDRYASHCASYRVSFWRDQVAYILSPREITPLDNVRKSVVVGGYDRDDLVTEAAASRAYKGLGADLLLRANVGHVAFWEQPQLWNEVFQHVFDALGY